MGRLDGSADEHPEGRLEGGELRRDRVQILARPLGEETHLVDLDAVPRVRAPERELLAAGREHGNDHTDRAAQAHRAYGSSVGARYGVNAISIPSRSASLSCRRSRRRTKSNS